MKNILLNFYFQNMEKLKSLPKVKNNRDNYLEKMSRRTFLKNTAVLGATLALSPKELLAQQKGELSDDANIKEIANFIVYYRESVDYAKLWDNEVPVLFLGERHDVISDKNELIKNLPNFRKNGMTHLAMEMLRESYQGIIDGYINGEIDRGEVLKIFKKGWNKGLGIPEKYMEIIDVAKSNGVRILAIDLYTKSSNYFTSDFFRKRNANWARIAKLILKKNKRARILFYCGQSHSGYNKVDDTANEILESVGIESKVVEFAGGKIAKGNAYFFTDKIAKAAQSVKLSGEKFSLRINSDDDVRGSDHIIHLPQIEM